MELTKEAFAEQVKDALLHIYDLAHLPPLELVRLVATEEGLTWQERMQRLRRALIQAIDRLDPGPGLPLRARERRSYAILSACYTRSMTAQAVMEELAISERQYWRDRKRAVEALVDQLWQDYGPPGPTEAAAIPSTLSEPEIVAREEADLLVAHSSPEELDLGEIVNVAAGDLRKMIAASGVTLQVESAQPSPLVFADRTLLRQICLNLLSQACHLAAGGTVLLQITAQPETVELTVSTRTTPGRNGAGEEMPLGLQIVRRLVEAQGGRMEVVESGTGPWCIAVSLPRALSLPVLVVDDNEAIVKLFQRYLAGTRYRVVGADSGPRALQLAGQLHPAAITLDVMMPGRDGWETLQTLRAMPELQGVPVIVCSILDEPQLAYSLGADDFLRKPVSQEALLHVLSRWVSQREAAGSRPPGGTAGI